MRRLGVGLLLAGTVVLSGCAVTPDSVPGVGVEVSGRGNPTAYLEYVKTTWTGDIPGDEVLFGYGDAACQQIAHGEGQGDIDVMKESLEPAAVAANTRSVVAAAALSLCPTAVSR